MKTNSRNSEASDNEKVEQLVEDLDSDLTIEPDTETPNNDSQDKDDEKDEANEEDHNKKVQEKQEQEQKKREDGVGALDDEDGDEMNVDNE